MMEALANFHFVRPWWLLALLPALGLFELERRAADAGDVWKSRIDPGLLSHLLVGGEERRRLTPALLLLAAWIVAIVSVAGPAWQREPSPFADAKPPVVALVKVAPSMMASDLAPTRLDRARQKLGDLIKLREGAATGLIAYAGSPHLVLPPTADGDAVVAMAGALSPEIMPKEGDDLAAALALARSVLDGAGQSGSILVLSDSVPPSAQGLDAGGIPVTILAMAPQPILEKEQGLADAAKALGATVIDTSIDQSDIAAVAERLDRVGQPRDVTGEGSHWKEAGYWLLPLLALITLAWFRRGWVLA